MFLQIKYLHSQYYINSKFRHPSYRKNIYISYIPYSQLEVSVAKSIYHLNGLIALNPVIFFHT